MRIAIGGFQHETNTFAPNPATLADFMAPDAWPGLTRGPALLEAVTGINLPAAGFIDAARSSNYTLLPLTWCSATPSGAVTREAYEYVSALLLEDLRKHRNIDAVYLDLHGAMVAEHIDDGDGELLRRVRALVGEDIPVVASLDFHANVSALMVEQASALVAYRTYPHVDMAQTGDRALRCLHALRSRPLARTFRQLPFLIPLTSQCTLTEPLAMLMATAERLESGPVSCMNFTPGFPASDVAECGPSVFAYGSDARAVTDRVDALVALIAAREREFSLEIYSIEAALQEATRIPAIRGRPVILADTQDNPGGGGTSDTTSLLKALVQRGVQRAVVGILCDPQAAAQAHAAGVGASIDVALGAHSSLPGETPLQARFMVVALGDGQFTGTGPFYRGARMNLGPMALLGIGDVLVAVASRKQQAADQAMFRHLGIEPADFALLALKSSVHFRADFGPISQRILVVAAPGANIADPAQLPFTKLRAGVRVKPAN